MLWLKFWNDYKGEGKLSTSTHLLLPDGSSHNLLSQAVAILSFAMMDFILQLLVKINPIHVAFARHFCHSNMTSDQKTF